MQREVILDFARSLNLGPPDRQTIRAEWISFACPLAPWKHASGADRSPSFGIHVDDDKISHYYCFACHSKGTLASLAYTLGRLRGTNLIHVGKEIEKAELFGPVFRPRQWDEIRGYTNAERQDIRAKAVIPPAEEEFSFPTAAGHPYLAERGISWHTAVTIGLRYDRYQRRVLFPVYEPFNGRFRGFSGRRVDPPYSYDDAGRPCEPDGNPYLKVKDYYGLRKRELFIGIPGSHHRPIGHPHTAIPLVEGLFAFARCVQAGFSNTRAILGSALTEEKVAILIKLGRPVILFLDNDPPGYDGRLKIIDQLFGKLPLFDVIWPEGTDGYDPHDLDERVIRKMLSNTVLITERFARSIY